MRGSTVAHFPAGLEWLFFPTTIPRQPIVTPDAFEFFCPQAACCLHVVCIGCIHRFLIRPYGANCVSNSQRVCPSVGRNNNMGTTLEGFTCSFTTYLSALRFVQIASLPYSPFLV